MTACRFAFFDVDETLINLKSMFSFRAHYLRRLLGDSEGARADARAQHTLHALLAQGRDRASVNRHYYQEFRGHRRADVQAAVQAWYAEVRTQPDFFIAPALAELRRHQQRGTPVVFVSGSCREILEPLAAELDVRYVLANQLEVDAQGRYTGELLPPQTIGAGKRAAVDAFLAECDADPRECWGYGDHVSDLPLLEAVGHPAVVAGQDEMLLIARHRGWPVLGAAAAVRH